MIRDLGVRRVLTAKMRYQWACAAKAKEQR